MTSIIREIGGVAGSKITGTSDDEIQEIVGKALAFVEQSPRRRGGLIAVVVNLDFCTVQQEEPIDVTMDRAIRTKNLYPLRLSPVSRASPQKNSPKRRQRMDYKLLDFLRDKLDTIRVEEVEQSSSLMEVCTICLRKPTFGAQILLLKCRRIVGWLESNHACSLCRQQAHTFMSQTKSLIN